MKSLLISAVAGLIFFGLGTSASASDLSLTTKFASGCFANNTTGNCTIKVHGKGTAVAGTVVKLESATSRRGRFTTFGRTRTLDSHGDASWRFKNVAPTTGAESCWRVATKHGQTTSNTICEK